MVNVNAFLLPFPPPPFYLKTAPCVTYMKTDGLMLMVFFSFFENTLKTNSLYHAGILTTIMLMFRVVLSTLTWVEVLILCMLTW